MTKKHLVHNYTRTNKARHFYNRVVRLWNKLSEINLENSFSNIKAHLTKFLWNYFLHSFHPDNLCSYHFCCPYTLSTYLLILINQIHLKSCYSVNMSFALFIFVFETAHHMLKSLRKQSIETLLSLTSKCYA